MSPKPGKSLSKYAQMNLDGLTLLVRSKVKACETVPTTRSSTPDTTSAADDLSEQLQRKAKVSTSACAGKGSSSCDRKDSSTTSGLTSTTSGDLLCEGPRLLELKPKNSIELRHAHEINWEDIYCQMTLGGTHKLVLGLHKCGTFDGVEELTIDEVKARADENGSSSMVYLANTLREVIKAAHCLMAGPSSSSGGKGGKVTRPVVVAQFLPTRSGEGTLRVRLAVPADGPIAHGPIAP